MSFEAGPYQWDIFLDSQYLSLGVIEKPPEIQVQPHHQEIRGDNLGQTLQDMIYLGQTLTIDLVFQEWNSHNFKLWWPYSVGADAHTRLGSLSDIGCVVSSVAIPMRATRIFNCPQNGGATYYYDKATLAPNFPIKYLMGSRLRNVPVKLILLPVLVSAGVYRHYQVVN